jgi:hypothetical protein
MRRADPHRALIRALVARYPGLLVLTGTSQPWASVTYTGARHTLTCVAGPNLTGIGEAEFALPGHIVADITAVRSGDRVTIEALTIEDA